MSECNAFRFVGPVPSGSARVGGVRRGAGGVRSLKRRTDNSVTNAKILQWHCQTPAEVPSFHSRLVYQYDNEASGARRRRVSLVSLAWCRACRCKPI